MMIKNRAGEENREMTDYDSKGPEPEPETNYNGADMIGWLILGGLAIVSYSIYELTGYSSIGWLVFGGGILVLGILSLVALCMSDGK